MGVRIMNRGKAAIQFGKTAEESFNPGGITIVDDAVAKKHLRLYPKILVDLDNFDAGADAEAKTKDFSGGKKKKADKTDDAALADALKSEKTEK